MKTNETGRSMVEMLGVLAIIGVLSVAGIAGYTQAMKKNKINNAVAELSMCVILAKTSNGGEGLTSTNASTSCDTLGMTFKSGISEASVVLSDGVYEIRPVVDNDAGFTPADLQKVAPANKNDAGYKKAGYIVVNPA